MVIVTPYLLRYKKLLKSEYKSGEHLDKFKICKG